MSHVRLLPIALVAIPLTLVARQPSPSFGGRWIAIEPDKIAGHELVVTQDATTLRLEQARLNAPQTYDAFGRRQPSQSGDRESTTYRLDGKALVTTHGDQSVRSSLHQDNGRILLRDFYQPGVLFERSLALDGHGRLVLEQRRPAVTDDAAQASGAVLEVRRIVFERR